MILHTILSAISKLLTLNRLLFIDRFRISSSPVHCSSSCWHWAGLCQPNCSQSSYCFTVTTLITQFSH